MARTKNYEAHIESLTEEINATQQKLVSLNAELEAMQKERDEHEVNALYKYIRENKISMSEIVKTLKSDDDGFTPKTQKTTTPKSHAKPVTVDNKSKQSASKTIKNNEQQTPARRGRPRKNPS